MRKMVSVLSVLAILFSMFPASVVPTISAATNDLEDNLILWYNFEQSPDSKTVKDQSGHNHDGVLNNNATLVTAEKGGAVQLDGDQDFVTMPSGILDETKNVTISTWVNVESAKDWATLYSIGDFTANADYAINYALKSAGENGMLELFGPSPFPSIETAGISVNEWVHVATVISEQTMHHYINGVLQGSEPIGIDSGDIVSATNYIGYHAMAHEQVENKGLHGKVSDFRIYNKALSVNDIRELADFTFDIKEVQEVNITTVVGTEPNLPAEVNVTYFNNTTEKQPVVWDEISLDDYASAGSFVVEGTIEGSTIKAKANITVTSDKVVTSVETISVSTTEGSLPNLPATIKVFYADNSSDEVNVTWDTINEDQYRTAGTSFTINGTVEGMTEKVEAFVYVTTNVSGDLVAWYKFDRLQGNLVPDLSGSGMHGTSVNGGTLQTVGSKQAIDLDHNNKQHVTLPSGIVNNVEDFTLSTWVYLDSKTGDWARIFDFGNGANQSTVFLTPNLRLDMRGSITTATSGAPKAGEWTHLAISKIGDQYTMYSNGLPVSKLTDDRAPGLTTRNFIGRSNYAADPYLDGKISDFRIYNEGLNEEEISQVIAESFSDEDAVNKAKETLSLGDTSAIVSNMDLPNTAGNGVTVSWTSNNQDVISNDGNVKRPSLEGKNATITLTATFSRNGYTDTKEYKVTVLADNIVSVEELNVMTPENFPPKLPEKVVVNYYDDSQGEMSVKWEDYSLEKLSKSNSFKVNGTVYGTDIKAIANIHVADLVSVEDVHVTTAQNVEPNLPDTVTAHYSNGMTDQLAVDWNEVNKNQYAKTGSFTVEGAAAKYNYTNPLIEQRADPNIYKHSDGYYYFTASVPEYNRIVMRRAKTIQGLANAKEVTIWEAHKSGEMAVHIWAPEIHFVDGKWYIHFAAGHSDDIWKIRPYVLESGDENPLTGTWVEKGMVQKAEDDTFSFTDFSLDATIFEHNGKRYFIWAQKEDGISNLYMAEMENAWTIKGKPMLLATPDYEWERRGFWVNEGPDVIKRNGKIFVSFSASATDSNYAIGLLTASDTSDLMDPKSWYKSPEPVMESNDATGQYGPGHSTFTVAEDGVTDILVYHSRSYKEIDGDPLYDPNRHTRVKKLTWNADGTPNFGIPNADGLVEGPTIEVKVHVTVIENTGYQTKNKFSLDKLEANKQLDVTTSVTNNSNSKESIMVVMALYDADNKMVDMKSTSKQIAKSKEETYKLGLKLPKSVQGHKVKVFVWKGESLEETSMMPVSKGFVLE